MPHRVVRYVFLSCAGCCLPRACLRAARPRDPDPVRLHQSRRPQSGAGRCVHRACRRCDGGDDQSGGAAASRPSRGVYRGPRLAVLHGFRRGRPVERNGDRHGHRYHRRSVFARIKERVGGISFLSFVLPRGRWSVAGVSAGSVKAARGAPRTEGAFFTDFNDRRAQEFREYPSIVARTLDVDQLRRFIRLSRSARCRLAPASTCRS